MVISETHKKKLLAIEKNLEQHAFPPQIVVETTSVCNMKCAHCNHKIMKRPKFHMSNDIYCKIIDEIALLAPDTEVWPTFYGEAFTLGDKLFERLCYARDKGLRNLVLNSNGKLLGRKDYIDQILTSGLKRFILSLDGFKKETFERIRVGGNRDKIYANVEKLLSRKKELGLEFPIIQCQFSAIDDNALEVAAFKDFWEVRGAEVKVRNMLSWTNSGDVVASNLDYETDFRIACPWGNNTMAIHANGNIVACAVDYEGNFVAGNVEEKSLKDIWQHDHYQKLRKIHREHRWNELPEVCKTCPDWQAVGAEYYENKTLGETKEEARPFWWKHREDS
ncbi:radical SAM/SPASM domain-containing protein [Sulfurospirillum barnesii]|uniref:Radical SAM additional 4Fe4S-binding domain protein n=1 Tax=Sulfurospirillum barnesii (strain ATCC 700032 / DSM 10660 / SES-3) TaxID=760154 RepID=I3Y0K4_SULBS|nr:radical SAM protein [Sulfurospirillum barnesii]AFL69728.1 radical SAM additional 4Fe4S-binding domain protein [Sulfurospirillum barnesii SES-3]